jgi:hypothetical protein
MLKREQRFSARVILPMSLKLQEFSCHYLIAKVGASSTVYPRP